MRETCTPANSVLENHLALAAKMNIIDRLIVVETRDGFFVKASFADRQNVMRSLKTEGLSEDYYVLAQLLSVPGKEWYLTTRRIRTEPRYFKDLSRLNDHLREAYPTERYEVTRCGCEEAAALPAKQSDSKKPKYTNRTGTRHTS